MGRTVSAADPGPDPSAGPTPAGLGARWLRSLPQGVYVALVVGVLVLLLLAAVLLNPGERVGPVRPAPPPVGGQDAVAEGR